MILNILIIVFQLGVVMSQLSVLSPQSLKQVFPKDIPYSLGNYGFVPYGEILFGKVDLSNPGDGCDIQFTDFSMKEPLSYKQFKLIQRGNCTFAQKTMNAQNEGYSMVIFIDNKQESIDHIQMVNRNHSLELDIPAILISEQDGTKLRNYIEQGEIVTLKMQFEIPQAKEIVNYEYWMSTMELESYEFINQFKPFQESMNNSLNFTPHYALWQMILIEILLKNWEVKNEMCLSGGRYCAPDPDDSGPWMGQDAVLEVVRQICIFRNYRDQWWNYASLYSEQCLNKSVRNIQECASSIQQQIDINEKVIDQCIDSSFEGEDKELADNNILKYEHNLFLSSGIQSWPLLVVNNQQYRGALALPTQEMDGKDIFDTHHYGPLQLICSGFVDERMPELCKERMSGYIKDGQIVSEFSLKQFKHKYKSDSYRVWVWVVSLVVVGLFMILAVFFYRRALRKAYQQELQLQVNMAVSQYYSLNEQQK